MTLKQWVENRWLRPHDTSIQEIASLFRIVERDLLDAGKDLSPDWSFGIAYNAALKLCKILLCAEGYRPERESAHYRTIEAMKMILGPLFSDDADYLQACRVKRNEAEYDRVGGVHQQDAKELIRFVREFRTLVSKWLAKAHPELIRKP